MNIDEIRLKVLKKIGNLLIKVISINLIIGIWFLLNPFDFYEKLITLIFQLLIILIILYIYATYIKIKKKAMK